jgi:hypothetical protein
MIDEEDKEEEEENEAMEEVMSLFEYQGHIMKVRNTHKQQLKDITKETAMNHRHIHQTLN